MVDEEKRNKFIQIGETRVNNVIHSIEILRPMAKSANYDYTKEDVEGMFLAIQEELDNVKEEFEAKFIRQERETKKSFSFGSTTKVQDSVDDQPESDIIEYKED